MDETRRVRISKFMSKYLRHEPHALGLELELGGWVLIDQLLEASQQAGQSISRDELNEIVRSCTKQRFAIDTSQTKIRANQGHSAEVDLQLEPAEPPEELFHGTALRNLDDILRLGLVRMARHHVHLSPDRETALKVGVRHGKPVLLVVAASKMRADDHVFFRSANGVWLVDCVPPQYLRALDSEN